MQTVVKEQNSQKKKQITERLSLGVKPNRFTPNDSNKIPWKNNQKEFITNFYCLTTYFERSRIFYHSGGDFFRTKQQDNEKAEQLYEEQCELRNLCGFNEISPVELLVFNFITSIGSNKLGEIILC